MVPSGQEWREGGHRQEPEPLHRSHDREPGGNQITYVEYDGAFFGVRAYMLVFF